MADDIQAQMQALMNREETPASPPPPPAPEGAPQDQGAAPPADPNAPPTEQTAKPPLTLEELEKREAQKTQALREERNARRHYERQLHEAQVARERDARERAQMLSNWQTLMTRMQAAQAGPDPRQAQPDPLANLEAQPLEALKALAQKVNQYETQAQEAERRAQEEYYQAQRMHEAQVQQARQVQALANTLQEYEKDFAVDAPDYEDGAAHYVEHRLKELNTTHGHLPQENLEKAVQYEILQMAQGAIQAGTNPARLIYEAAKLRGYAGPKPKAQQQAAAAPNQSDPLKLVREGQAAATSLSAGGAGHPAGEPQSLENILKLDGAAFESASAKFLKQMTGRSFG